MTNIFNIREVEQDYQIITDYAEQEQAMKVTFLRKAASGEKPAAFEMASFYGEGKHDICISTLAGCSRQCTFCSIPTYRGFDDYLTPQEIILQVAYAIHTRNPAHELPNIVGMMGNGEPFGNMKLSEQGRPFLFEALEALLPLPIDRLTISTVGDRPDVLQKFVEFARTLPATIPIKLQCSLHTPFEQERQKLIPTARKPLARTIKVLDEYTAISGQPVQYNVVLMVHKDSCYTNATPAHAKAVARLILSPSLFEGTPVKRILKLSVYNLFPGAAFVPVSEEATQRYIEILRENGVMAIKTFKGSGIAIDEEKNTGGFSCGQLAVTTRGILSTATH